MVDKRLFKLLQFLCLIPLMTFHCSEEKTNITEVFLVTSPGDRTTGETAQTENQDVTNGETDSAISSGWVACETTDDCTDETTCIEGPDGAFCVTSCEELCPEGWACITEDDKTTCLMQGNVEEPTLCYPCRTDDDCSGLFNGGCVPYGPAGSFCANTCTTTDDCDPGFSCAPTEEAESWGRCIATSNACQCSDEAIEFNASTNCYAITDNEAPCEGIRVCTEEGLSSCTVGLAEICDGIDNDCDGNVDNDLENCIPDPKVDADGDGFSVAEGDCNDDDNTINPAAIDSCDGINNDCDTLIDEDAGTPACPVSNDNGTCTGKIACIGGEEVCEGSGPNECGDCNALPDAYGEPCGCGGVIGCEGTCEGETGNPCTPAPCFVGKNGTEGQVGCPEQCSTCPLAPWRLCFCSAGIGEPSLSFSPGSLTIGESLLVSYWSPVPVEGLALRINTVNCVGAPEVETCEDPDNCGGVAYIWKNVSPNNFQLGSNTLDVLSNVSSDTCEGELQSVEVRGFVPLAF